jgi:hypothetical protein
MTQLIIDGQNIDLYDSDPINLKYQFTDVNNIQSSTGSFSQTFRIPATANNYLVFGDMASPNDVVFNPKVKVSAIISVDTLPVMRGHVQFKKAYIIDGQHDEYEIVFFGEAVNLSRTIGEKKLRDIDLSALDHVVSSTNLALSWVGALFSGNIRYGLIDKGNVWANENNGNAITINNPLYAGSFTPFVRLRYLLNELFTQNGFTMVSTFFNAEADYYVPYHNGKNYVIPAGTLEEVQFTAGLSADNVTGTLGNTVITVPLTNWNDSTTPFFDGLNIFNTVNGQITVPYTAVFSFSVNLTAFIQNSGLFQNVQVWFTPLIRRISDGVYVGSAPPQSFFIGIHFMTFNITTTLSHLEQYELRINMQPFNGGNTLTQITFESAFSTDPAGGGSWFSLLPTSEPLYGQNCVVSNNAPDIKQMDFLRSLQTMFNLVFAPDPNDPTVITVEPFNDYMAAGAIKDFTEDLDTSTDIVLYPTTDLQSKNYQWTYTADGDILNQAYVKTAGRVYGRYLIEEADNDFAVGEKKIECKFGAYPVNAITGTTILIHKSYTDSGAIVSKPLCKVVIWGGLQAGTYVYFNEVLLAPATAQTYPYFGHYNAPVPSFSGEDLNFGAEQPLHPINSNPFNNLYNTYWRAYVDQLYSASARIMEANFYLSGVDLAAFRFNDQIFVKDSYWRVLSIDYSPNSNGTSKLQLIKVLDPLPACAIIPVSANLDGSINFELPDGSPAPATQFCCEAFGYVWSDGGCFNSIIGGGVQPNTPALPTSNLSSVNSNGSGLSVLVGQEIQASFYNALAVGRSITIGGDRHIALGDDIVTGAQADIVAMGVGVNGFMQGQHFGGGYNFDTGISPQGYAQHGQFMMIYNGDFDLGDTVELFVNGIFDERIVLPADASLTVKMTFAIQYEDLTPPPAIISEVLEFNDLWTKYPLAGTYSVGAFAPDFQLGAFGGVLTCTVDTATNTAQHRVLLTNTNVVNTQPTRIICVVRYTMATL